MVLFVFSNSIIALDTVRYNVLYFKKEVILCEISGEYKINNQQFCNSFYFFKIIFTREHQTDHTGQHGAPRNYIGMIISGSGRLVTAEKTLCLQKGEPFFIPMGCKYHSYWFPESGEVSWHSLGFELFPLSGDKKPAIQKLCFNKSAERHFESIVSNYSVNSGSVGSLYMLLSDLESTLKYEKSSRNPTVEAAMDLINRDPFLSMSSVTKSCGVSESTLYSVFRNLQGFSPNFARQRVLCEKAVRLLETTDCPIEEISNELGFSSSSYFRKVLRLHTGHTPREIRKNALF